MDTLLPLISLFTVLILSILVNRIATIALVHTGLSRQVAQFQARSAFTGVGFTTSEAESVINHPVRRRIILSLMLMGNAGIVTAISSLILTFLRPESDASVSLWTSLLLLFLGVAILWRLAHSQTIDRWLSKVISRLLQKHSTLEIRDYASLLQLEEDYRVSELELDGEDWLEGRPLRESKLRDEGVIVLAIRRADGRFVGAPVGDTVPRSGDVLVLYGKSASIDELDSRRHGMEGDEKHRDAVSEHDRRKAAEQGEDAKAERV